MSDDVRANVQQAVTKNCGNFSNQCIEAVRETIFSGGTELNSRSADVIGFYLVSYLMAMLSIAWWEGPRVKEIPVALNIHDDFIAQASSAIAASTVAIATGEATPIVTFTVKPVPTLISATG